MVAEATTNPSHHHHNSSSSGEEKHHKQLDRDMVSAITNRVYQLHKDGHGHHDDDDDDGVRIITLAGTNTGATMKSELDHEKSPNQHDHDQRHHHGGSLGDRDALHTYVNSNFQAINNSIMMGGSYTTNDPGVHMDIADSADHHHGHGPHAHTDSDKLAKKDKKNKDKDSSKSE